MEMLSNLVADQEVTVASARKIVEVADGWRQGDGRPGCARHRDP